MAPQPCKECKRRPKAAGRHRCVTCQLRHEPIGDQVAEARRRLAMVPEELRRKRTATIQRLAPAGTGWCAGCQSFRDLEDFGKGTTCRACASAKQHGAMIEKTYGLTAAEYDRLLEFQGGKCAICRGRPRSKRLAVDHDHGTGAVRGLLCSKCNHDLLGSAWDSKAMATALWHYLNTPPTTGTWLPPEIAPQLAAQGATARESDPAAELGIVARRGDAAPATGGEGVEDNPCGRAHYLPVGWVPIDGKRGVYWVDDAPDGDATF